MIQMIKIKGAAEGNLKNVSLEIPRNNIVVFTGLSGSGKTTLAIDVIYNECQRQFLEAIGYQGIRKPNIDQITNLSPSILITQNELKKNPRSSVGTLTNIYTGLRMIFEKLGDRTCPNCNKKIKVSECKEETYKENENFYVFMFCKFCGHKMNKLTRTYFSYNTREGACPICHGLGRKLEINYNAVINDNLSLESGAVDFWKMQYKDFQINSLYNAFKHYNINFEPDTPVKLFSSIQKNILLHGSECDEVKKIFSNIAPPKTVNAGKFEGIYNTLWRRLSDKDGSSKKIEPYFVSALCPECHGERLNKICRESTVLNKRLPELVILSLNELSEWIISLETELADSEKKLIEPYILDLKTKIRRIANVGLAYLSLDRQSITLSGGEAQRIKLAAVLDSTLTGIIYILDEPTIGLHTRDTREIIGVLKDLKNLGNTIIVIEHDTDIMNIADFIVDIGPLAGKHGGEIIACGKLSELLNNKNSITGNYLNKKIIPKKEFRKPNGKFIEIKNAALYNLKNINVKIPVGCMTAIAGVSGSGKTTLVFEVIAGYNAKLKSDLNQVFGLEYFDNIIPIEQSPLFRMNRSNIATYSGVYSEIRKIFCETEAAKKSGLTINDFSFNTKGGRCENCEGLGVVESNMLFFDDTIIVCPECLGNRFNDTVLSVKYKNYSINEILKMTVEEGLQFFIDNPKITKILNILFETGLGYLELGQTLTTLSGGECQRLKFAKELTASSRKNNLYLIDEPTTGLHPVDVENFLVLLNKITDRGNTVIIVEHNLQIIRESDWVIDLGPGGGIYGGNVIAVGTPEEIKNNDNSITGKFL